MYCDMGHHDPKISKWLLHGKSFVCRKGSRYLIFWTFLCCLQCSFFVCGSFNAQNDSFAPLLANAKLMIPCITILFNVFRKCTHVFSPTHDLFVTHPLILLPHHALEIHYLAIFVKFTEFFPSSSRSRISNLSQVINKSKFYNNNKKIQR